MELPFFSSLYQRNNVHYMRISLNMHEISYLYRSKLCDAPHIISCKVNKHHMLRFLLWIFHQSIRKQLIFYLIFSTRSCSRNRTGQHLIILLLNKHLRRTSDNLKLFKIKIIHIRRRIDLS